MFLSPQGSPPHTHKCFAFPNLLADIVQIHLELVLDISGQVCAAAFNLFHFQPLAFTGEVEGLMVGKQTVDPIQEIPGHCLDPVQRTCKVLFALPS